MVNVCSSSPYADLQPKLVGLGLSVVSQLVCSTFVRWAGWIFTMTLLWWQHLSISNNISFIKASQIWSCIYVCNLTAGVPPRTHSRVQVHTILAVRRRVCRLADWRHYWVPRTPQQDQYSAWHHRVYQGLVIGFDFAFSGILGQAGFQLRGDLGYSFHQWINSVLIHMSSALGVILCLLYLVIST